MRTAISDVCMFRQKIFLEFLKSFELLDLFINYFKYYEILHGEKMCFIY